jgi:SPASM domain peptide maturase of grasp-with-spasm system
MKYYRLFACCICIRGFSRSIILDHQRNLYSFIPNNLCDFIQLKPEFNKKELKDYMNGDIDIVNNILTFMNKEEYIFEFNSKTTEIFPHLNFDFEYPAKISNCIFDVEDDYSYLNKELVNTITKYGCKDIQLRFYKEVDIQILEKILFIFDNTKIKSIDIISSYIKEDNDLITSFLHKYKRIKSIFFYNSPSDLKSILNSNTLWGNIIYMPQKINPQNNCGEISETYFSNNITLFTESQHYNTCLNRKICIDANGDFKNCPSMSRSFGNIKDTTLEEALNKPGFKDLWGIRKDDIDVCKDCEFRYMCTDCRAFIKDPDSIYSQPAKCPYNPYIAKWEGEEGYLTVEAWREQNPNWKKKAKRKPLVKIPQKVE